MESSEQFYARVRASVFNWIRIVFVLLCLIPLLCWIFFNSQFPMLNNYIPVLSTVMGLISVIFGFVSIIQASQSGKKTDESMQKLASLIYDTNQRMKSTQSYMGLSVNPSPSVPPPPPSPTFSDIDRSNT